MLIKKKNILLTILVLGIVSFLFLFTFSCYKYQELESSMFNEFLSIYNDNMDNGLSKCTYWVSTDEVKSASGALNEKPTNLLLYWLKSLRTNNCCMTFMETRSGARPFGARAPMSFSFHTCNEPSLRLDIFATSIYHDSDSAFIVLYYHFGKSQVSFSRYYDVDQKDWNRFREIINNNVFIK